ncbi:MAG: hypothetical protein RLY86_367 [Pseudomonadota bacterium]|jgi:predicted nucleotidyltransferase
MNPAIRPILEELKAGLTALYGDRLDRVILYGSQARGDARPDSDIDVLVVLTGPWHRLTEIERTGPLVSGLSLAHDITLTLLFGTAEDLGTHPGLFYGTVRREGIRL